MFERRVQFALCCCFVIFGTSRLASAQDAVTASSGSPAAIGRIRTVFTSVERNAARYRQTVHDLQEFSLEGGVLHGFYDGAELRKLAAREFGESWRGTEEYYFSRGQLVFIYVVHERYDEPMSGRVRARIENRYYLESGRLIRRVRTQTPSTVQEDLSSFDPKLPDLLTSAKLFAACAAAKGTNPPACTAPGG